MKKVLLFIVATIICATAFSQVIKSEEIASYWIGGSKIIKASWECDDECKKPTILIIAQDHRYRQLKTLITVVIGQPYEVYAFLTSVEQFADKYKSEKSVSAHIDRQMVSKVTMLGSSAYNIYELNGSGYHAVTLKDIAQFKVDIEKWAKKNNVNLNETVSVSNENEEKSKNNNEEKSVVDKIKQAKELLDAGAITQEEFEAIKKKILEQ